MPELPEVETLRRGLEKYLVGYVIESVEVKKPKLFSGNPKDIIGAKITDVKRFGKGLVIDLSNNYSLAIHIKLTGQLIYKGVKEIKETKETKGEKEQPSNALLASGFNKQEGRVEVPNNATHIIFHLDKGVTLFYNDVRQFGWIKIVKSDKLQDLPFFKDLGPEFPLVSGAHIITKEQFSNLLGASKTTIKPLLMDQKKISGIGNIYANDGLYLAKINPKRPANSLTKEEAQRLFDALMTVLKKGLEEGGASELTFVNVLGQMGNYQNHTQIYGHTGETCKRDGTIITKYMLAGRGTYVCPTCQK